MSAAILRYLVLLPVPPGALIQWRYLGRSGRGAEVIGLQLLTYIGSWNELDQGKEIYSKLISSLQSCNPACIGPATVAPEWAWRRYVARDGIGSGAGNGENSMQTPAVGGPLSTPGQLDFNASRVHYQHAEGAKNSQAGAIEEKVDPFCCNPGK
ncbi:hypothetical protein B0T22DRAFT_234695 [Podospora appendiculata]|uniref:Uncharacterized protein n=1 Tax=Podospora appendiculata TaxID=314037 RepID=A0AAE0X6L1_9PEZI|nr:hypothetical protein B0T22DRAFT_234695 [Podospora appendiculata]